MSQNADLKQTMEHIAAGRTSNLVCPFCKNDKLKKGAGDYGLLSTGSGIVSFANFYPVLARYENGAFERAEQGGVGEWLVGLGAEPALERLELAVLD